MTLFEKETTILGAVFEDLPWYFVNGSDFYEVKKTGSIYYYNGHNKKLPVDKVFIKDGWTLQNYKGEIKETDDFRPEQEVLKSFSLEVIKSQGNEYLFYIRRYSEQELFFEKLRADIDYLMFMTDLYEPVMLASVQTAKASTFKTLSTTQSSALNEREEKIKRYFDMGMWTMDMVRNAYQKGIITSAAHFKAITGETI